MLNMTKDNETTPALDAKRWWTPFVKVIYGKHQSFSVNTDAFLKYYVRINV